MFILDMDEAQGLTRGEPGEAVGPKLPAQSFATA